MKPRLPLLRIIVGLILITGAIGTASLLIGAETLSAGQAWTEWQSGRPIRECPTLSILFHQRLPRTLTAWLAGGALALVGCAFQGLLRNPLATPYTLGIASAGALGAWVATVFLQGTALWITVLVFSPVQASAFLFASLNALLIYLLAARNPRMTPSMLLLTGVTLGMLCNAGILFLRYLATPDRLVVMDRWLMGGVDVVGFDIVKTLLIGVTPCVLILLAQSAKLDQLGFGAELAASRGIHVGRLQAIVFFVGSLLTAIIASTVGPIGFVGLIVPHSVRAITGSRHRLLMPISLFSGGAFLCFCDIIARRLLTGETPIGIITSLFGGPFFLYLLTRKRFTDWES